MQYSRASLHSKSTHRHPDFSELVTEGCYASIFYCYFTAMGLDMSVRLPHAAYVFEFKVVDILPETGNALAQIRAKGYHRQYLGQGKPVYLVGVEFHAEKRNVERVEWEETVD